MNESKRNLRNGLLFISPWIIGFILFTAYPLINSLYYSFTNYSVINTPTFIGLDNYKNLFFHDKLFITSIENTVYMVVIGITITTIVTVLISILLNDKRLKGSSFFRVVFFMPTLVPTVILSILWIWIFQPESGVVNSILKVFGINGPGWFASPVWSKPAFIIMGLWGAGNMIIIYLAGLQDIDVSLYEAVSIDGGNYLDKLRHITLPLLKPVILFNVITGVIKTLQSFAEAFIITSGGPVNSTTFYSLYLYQNAFQYTKMGYASAMAWILLIIAMLFTVVLFKFTGWAESEY